MNHLQFARHFQEKVYLLLKTLEFLKVVHRMMILAIGFDPIAMKIDNSMNKVCFDKHLENDLLIIQDRFFFHLNLFKYIKLRI